MDPQEDGDWSDELSTATLSWVAPPGEAPWRTTWAERASQPEQTVQDGDSSHEGGSGNEQYGLSFEGCTIGTPDLCGHAPLTNRPGGGDWSVFDTDGLYATPYEFRGDIPFTDDMRALIGDAWALLDSNEDLVRWASCMGNPTKPAKADCLVESIRGERGTIRFKRKDCGSGNASMSTPPEADSNRSMLFCTGEASFLEKLVDMYTQARPDFVAATAECAVFILAETILHELVHVCGYAGPRPEPNNCSRAYLVENHFVDVGLRRFNVAAESQLCRVPPPPSAGSDDPWFAPTEFNPSDYVDDSDYINPIRNSESDSGDLRPLGDPVPRL